MEVFRGGSVRRWHGGDERGCYGDVEGGMRLDKLLR